MKCNPVEITVTGTRYGTEHKDICMSHNFCESQCCVHDKVTYFIETDHPVLFHSSV